jgi:hypothetical protein
MISDNGMVVWAHSEVAEVVKAKMAGTNKRRADLNRRGIRGMEFS